MRRNIVTVSVLVGLLAGAAAGDKLTLRGNMSLPIDRVIGFKDGQVVYTTASGTEKSRGLNDIMQIAIDGQDSFNQAEQLRAEKKGSDAASMYESVAAGGDTPPWLAQIARYRKVEVLGKDKAIGTAVSAWLEIVTTDVSSEAATLLPRELPGKGDPQNAQAIIALKARMGEIKSDLARQSGKKLLVELYRREGQDDEADKVFSQATGGAAKGGSDANSGKAAPVASNDGGSSSAASGSDDDGSARAVSGAGSGGMIRANQKPAVLAEQVDKLTNDLPRCIAAELGPTLVLIGKGKLYQALQEKADSPTRKGLLVGAGVAFMRAKTAATKASNAAEALYFAGQTCEHLGNVPAAESAYRKVLADYKAAKEPGLKDVVAEAQRALDKLSSKKSG